MEYECSIVSLDKLMFSPGGFVSPLCDQCSIGDCTNNIENREISIIGVIQKHKVLIKGNNIYFVVKCDGFV